MKFFTFEGGEGSGKSTQAALLFQALNDSGTQAILTREPGGTNTAEEIRKVILSTGNNFHPITELLLHNAARYENAKNLIIPALKENKYVVCDRFVDSTMAYQGYGHKIGKKLPALLHNLLMEGLAPDLTFILDVPVDVGLKRVKLRKEQNKYEQLTYNFHERVRDGFLEIANIAQNRCILIDAQLSKEEIHNIIIDSINSTYNLNLKTTKNF